MQKRPQTFQTWVDAEVQINMGSLHYPLQTLYPENSKKLPRFFCIPCTPPCFRWQNSFQPKKANMKSRKNPPRDAHGFPWSISQAVLATCNSRRHGPTIHLRSDRGGKTVDDLGAGSRKGNFRRKFPNQKNKIPKIVSPSFWPNKILEISKTCNRSAPSNIRTM